MFCFSVLVKPLLVKEDSIGPILGGRNLQLFWVQQQYFWHFNEGTTSSSFNIVKAIKDPNKKKE